MKVFGQELVFETENKKKAILCAGLLVFTIGFTASNLFKDTPSPTPSNNQQQSQNTSVSENTANTNESKVDLSNVDVNIDYLASKNPFVERQDLIDGLDMAAEQNRDNTNHSSNATNGSANVTVPSSASKPFNLPGNFSLPSIPTNDNGVNLPNSQSSSGTNIQSDISGVMVGEDGSTLAIMSDGQLVQNGDNYQGKRIANISKDGISFDDGSSIIYK